MRPTALMIVLLATTAFAATAASQQQSLAMISPDVTLDGSTIRAPDGTMVISDGTGTVRGSSATGTVDVWTKTITCLERSEGTCLEDSSTTQQTYKLENSSFVMVQRNRSPVIMLSGEASTLSTLATDSAHITTAEENETVVSISEPEAPDRYTEWTMPAGIRTTSEAGVDGSMDGVFNMRAFDTVLTARTTEGEQEIVTGWEWQEEGNLYQRVLRLVDIELTGSASVLWDGPMAHNSATPVVVQADQAEVELLEGSIDGQQAPTSLTLDATEFTITERTRTSDGEPALSIQQGLPTPDAPPTDEPVDGTVLVGAGAAAMAAIAATGYYWPRLTWGATALALPMYSRIEKDELFENEVRENLYELIQDDPGIHAHALSEQADVGWGTTVYHLRRLERNGFVTSERRGRYRRFFPAAGFLARQREVLSVLQNETTNDIARLILREPGLNQSAICDELDISPSLANWHINRLLDAELVERERRGRTVHYTPGEAWNEVEDALDPDFQDALEGVKA